MSEWGRPPREMGPGGERAEPPWDHAPAPRELVPQYEAQDSAARAGLPRDLSRLTAQVQGQQVTLAALVLIAASLAWKGAFLGHFYFRQDDFDVMDQALKSGLTWKLLTFLHTGHLYPGVYLISWILAHTALYSWAAGAGVELVLIAASSLAAWRLLRTLLGNRPALLIPLALYVLSPLPFQAYSWWIAGVEAIPLQIAIFMSLDAHVRHVWTGRFRYAVLAAAWLVFGLFFFEKSAVIPVLLFAVTAGYLVRRRSLLLAIGTALARFWRAWALYLFVLTAYAVVFLVALSGSRQQPGPPTSGHIAATFGWGVLFHSFVPGILGGPWQWNIKPGDPGGGTAAPVVLSWAALFIVFGVILASMLTRWRAWRGWAILLGWLVLDDFLPVLVGRIANFPGYAAVLATQTRYVDDAMAVLAVVIALIFWPLAGPQGDRDVGQARRREFFTSVQWKTAAIALTVVSAVGSLWSVSQLTRKTTVSSREYVANAKAALRQQPKGMVILDQRVPASVMISAFGSHADTSVVLGPLALPGAHVTWTSQPAGNIGGLRMFGPDGQLDFAHIQGVTVDARDAARKLGDCLTAQHPRRVEPLPPAGPGLAPFIRVLRIDYLADAPADGGSVSVQYNGITKTIPITGRSNNFYMAVTGAAPQVTLQATLSAGNFCFVDAVAGYFIALPGAGGLRV